MKKRLWLIIILTSLMTGRLAGQDVFFAEVGLFGGGGYVLGDRNSVPFRTLQPNGGAFLKYKFNGYWELKLQGRGGLLGINKTDGLPPKVAFGDIQVLGEFNFFNFGVQKWQPHRTWVSPSVVAGVGMTIFDGRVTMSIPMGIGVKFKLSNRVNMGAYWVTAKVFSDALDFVENPIGLNGNVFNNRDWYSTVEAYLSINFGKICAPCRNRVRLQKEQSKYRR